MLLEYSVSNYKSFNEEAYFDLRPAKGRILNRYPGNYTELPTGERALKDAIIVGENAGGKSNFIESVAYLRDLLVRTDMRPVSRKSLVNSGRLAESAKGDDVDALEQGFSVGIALDNATYTYSLKLAPWGVLSESLEMKAAKRKPETVIFEALAELQEACADCEKNAECEVRESQEVAQCVQMRLVYGKKGSLRENDVARMKESLGEGAPGLMLVWLAAIGDEHCRRVLNWFTDDLFVVRMDSSRSIQTNHEVSDLLEVMGSDEYLKVLQLIDASIVGLTVDETRPFDDSVITREDGEGRAFERIVKQDSAGVRTFLVWAYFIYKVIREGKTVLADEIDITINPVLSERVLALINGVDHDGQLVFTTHNVFNLTLRTSMKEQIYFITKDPTTLESSLYSAADFSEIRYDVKEELYEFYLSGMLGGTVHV
ncbi:MAG: ATP-binding protein [Eggerthellaceae bacterium]|nr:ATP-binding protein [Eggerthellaceae bacterium]